MPGTHSCSLVTCSQSEWKSCPLISNIYQVSYNSFHITRIISKSFVVTFFNKGTSVSKTTVKHKLHARIFYKFIKWKFLRLSFKKLPYSTLSITFCSIYQFVLFQNILIIPGSKWKESFLPKVLLMRNSLRQTESLFTHAEENYFICEKYKKHLVSAEGAVWNCLKWYQLSQHQLRTTSLKRKNKIK